MSDVHLSLKNYFRIYTLLLIGLAATVGVAYVPLGAANVFVAMAIAVAKAALVVLYFMHVVTAPRLNRVVIGAGLVWLAILLVVILSDYLTRNWIPGRTPSQMAFPARSDDLQLLHQAAGVETQPVLHAVE